MGASDDSGVRLADHYSGGSGGNVVSLHKDAGRAGEALERDSEGRDGNHVRVFGQVWPMKVIIKWYHRTFGLSDETQKACKEHHDTWCRVQKMVDKEAVEKFKEQGV